LIAHTKNIHFHEQLTYFVLAIRLQGTCGKKVSLMSFVIFSKYSWLKWFKRFGTKPDRIRYFARKLQTAVCVLDVAGISHSNENENFEVRYPDDTARFLVFKKGIQILENMYTRSRHAPRNLDGGLLDW